MKPFLPRLSKSALGSAHPKPFNPAFIAVDLVLGAAVAILVVGALGGVALISELRMARDAEVTQSLRDKWGRTLQLITNEANQAYWLRTSLQTDPGYPCTGTAPENPLVLDGPPDPASPGRPIWRVVYGVRTNPPNSENWRGATRLVRCGPPFERVARDDTPQARRAAALRAAALGGNLSYSEPYTETVITDQMPAVSQIPCPQLPANAVSAPCFQPFYPRLFDTSSTRDRDAQVNLFLGRGAGLNYPPAFYPGFHAQIRANRNPGFNTTGSPACTTSTDSFGNQEPPVGNPCLYDSPSGDSSRRRVTLKEYNLSNSSGDLRINACGPSCEAARLTDVIDVIFLRGNFDDFTVKQFSAADNRPCTRKSCYLSNGSQNVQIYDGNMVVFYDRIMRL